MSTRDERQRVIADMARELGCPKEEVLDRFRRVAEAVHQSRQPVQSTYVRQLDLLIDPQEHTVICPRCGNNYSHIREVFTRLGNDPVEGGVAYAGTVAKGVVNDRRDCLVIQFNGECGHLFEWQIQQYKGYNFVTACVTGHDPSFCWATSEMHPAVYAVVKALEQEGIVPNRVTVADQLMVRGELEEVGGLTYLMTLDLPNPDTSNNQE